MNNNSLPAKPHYLILDGLRGVAAIIGFVIGYAYDDRWHKMTNGTFVKRRIVRKKLG